jgi:hypothetical protein
MCQQGKAAQAYESASAMFKIERTPKYFEARTRELFLDKITDMQWGPMEGKAGAFFVPAELKVMGDKGPLVHKLVTSLVQENGRWRVLEVRQEFPNGTSEDAFGMIARSVDGNRVNTDRKFVDPVSLAVPTEAQLHKLVEEALLKFDASVKAGEFTELFEFVSDRWKYRGRDERTIRYTGSDKERMQKADYDNVDQRITVSALKREFGKFIVAKVDLSPIKGKKMILDEPASITTEGVLKVNGTFDTSVFQGENPPIAEKMIFKLEFVLEGAKWRIYGISVTLPNSGRHQ